CSQLCCARMIENDDVSLGVDRDPQNLSEISIVGQLQEWHGFEFDFGNCRELLRECWHKNPSEYRQNRKEFFHTSPERSARNLKIGLRAHVTENGAAMVLFLRSRQLRPHLRYLQWRTRKRYVVGGRPRIREC